ncbi:hypothetical protein L3X38_017646 [Prunus dulcis]|uniref:Aminotransferase-like plant mobile domain-containing protein n=1 Tax=Prunus dulcis TaxID=3755 RepID=A0AAD4W7I4_PRUDU|nr:hypothetical protein L3X38_017646 [Prunus dulcis]
MRFLSTESLNGKDQKGMPYIPHICRYLFLAYHKILWDSKGKYGVRMITWIKYWYRGPFKYKKPSRKTIRNKSQKPKEDFDPSGIIVEALKLTEMEEGVFEDLAITNEDMERSYLAAFLACWLCKFVFPKDDITLIRPRVFKVASRMVHGVSFGLAIPVLASIYKGLNDISSIDDDRICPEFLGTLDESCEISNLTPMQGSLTNDIASFPNQGKEGRDFLPKFRQSLP